MAPTKGSQQFFVVLLPKYVVVSPPQFLVVRLLQFLACCRAGLLAVNNRRLRTIFGQSVDSRHWSRLIYGITSDSSRFSRLLFPSKISFFCSPHLFTLIKQHKIRDAILSKKCSFFEHCSNGGGVNPCSKIMSEIVVCSGGHLTT